MSRTSSDTAALPLTKDAHPSPHTWQSAASCATKLPRNESWASKSTRLCFPSAPNSGCSATDFHRHEHRNHDFPADRKAHPLFHENLRSTHHHTFHAGSPSALPTSSSTHGRNDDVYKQAVAVLEILLREIDNMAMANKPLTLAQETALSKSCAKYQNGTCEQKQHPAHHCAGCLSYKPGDVS